MGALSFFSTKHNFVWFSFKVSANFLPPCFLSKCFSKIITKIKHANLRWVTSQNHNGKLKYQQITFWMKMSEKSRASGSSGLGFGGELWSKSQGWGTKTNFSRTYLMWWCPAVPICGLRYSSKAEPRCSRLPARSRACRSEGCIGMWLPVEKKVDLSTNF
jgi:hypothetical protein